MYDKEIERNITNDIYLQRKYATMYATQWIVMIRNILICNSLHQVPLVSDDIPVLISTMAQGYSRLTTNIFTAHRKTIQKNKAGTSVPRVHSLEDMWPDSFAHFFVSRIKTSIKPIILKERKKPLLSFFAHVIKAQYKQQSTNF